MMKKFLVLSAVAGLSGLVHGSYLCWQVTGETGRIDAYDFNAARVFYGPQGGEYQAASIVNAAGDSLGTAVAVGADNTMPGVAYVDLSTIEGDLSTYCFYIELANWNSSLEVYTHVAQSKAQSYTSLSGSVTDTLSSISPMTLAVWHGAGVPVPEPSSALMILLGLSGLALKRRRV